MMNDILDQLHDIYVDRSWIRLLARFVLILSELAPVELVRWVTSLGLALLVPSHTAATGLVGSLWMVDGHAHGRFAVAWSCCLSPGSLF